MNSPGEPGKSFAGVTKDEIVAYLQEHPEFFTEHPELLTELDIPHQSGAAVSLVEKQVSVLREQTQQANQRLHELIEIARQNEELARRMHQLSLTLMDAGDPRDIFPTLYDNLTRNFHADRVVVRLFADPAFLDIEAGDEFVGSDNSGRSLFKSIINSRHPLCGRMKHQQQVFLFGDEGDEIASSVMVPLKGDNWSGILAIGSTDPDRFQPGMGVELLANLGEILSFIFKPWIAE
ncbi:MAG: DUF484 family protein [Gammaproteobacteria bacterium]|nr:DUF484 family protein [Gammaproteobacteria bacterium]